MPAVREMLSPNALAEWSVKQATIPVLSRAQHIPSEGLTWAVDSTFAFLNTSDLTNDACDSFTKAWSPIFGGIMRFALPFDDVQYEDITSGQQDRNVILVRGPLDESEKSAILTAIRYTK